MKDNAVLFVIGLVGALVALVSAEMKDTIADNLPFVATLLALPPAVHALPPALVSAYASIKIARIKAEADKARQPLPAQSSWLDILLWAVLVFILLVIAFVVGALGAVALLGGYF